MQVAPEWLLDQLHVSFLRGSLAALAMHPSGNFGVQAYLSALQTPQQVLLLPAAHLQPLACQSSGAHAQNVKAFQVGFMS